MRWTVTDTVAKFPTTNAMTNTQKTLVRRAAARVKLPDGVELGRVLHARPRQAEHGAETGSERHDVARAVTIEPPAHRLRGQRGDREPHGERAGDGHARGAEGVLHGPEDDRVAVVDDAVRDGLGDAEGRHDEPQ